MTEQVIEDIRLCKASDSSPLIEISFTDIKNERAYFNTVVIKYAQDMQKLKQILTQIGIK